MKSLIWFGCVSVFFSSDAFAVEMGGCGAVAKAAGLNENQAIYCVPCQSCINTLTGAKIGTPVPNPLLLPIVDPAKVGN